MPQIVVNAAPGIKVETSSKFDETGRLIVTINAEVVDTNDKPRRAVIPDRVGGLRN